MTISAEIFHGPVVITNKNRSGMDPLEYIQVFQIKQDCRCGQISLPSY